jgi:hypothetical protein
MQMKRNHTPSVSTHEEQLGCFLLRSSILHSFSQATGFEIPPMHWLGIIEPRVAHLRLGRAVVVHFALAA